MRVVRPENVDKFAGMVQLQVKGLDGGAKGLLVSKMCAAGISKMARIEILEGRMVLLEDAPLVQAKPAPKPEPEPEAKPEK